MIDDETKDRDRGMVTSSNESNESNTSQRTVTPANNPSEPNEYAKFLRSSKLTMTDTELIAELVNLTYDLLEGALTKDEHSDQIVLLLIANSKVIKP